MVSGQWFQRKYLLRIYLKIHKVANYSVIESGGTPIFTILVGLYPRNIYTKFEANLCICLREDKLVILHSDL